MFSKLINDGIAYNNIVDEFQRQQQLELQQQQLNYNLQQQQQLYFQNQINQNQTIPNQGTTWYKYNQLALYNLPLSLWIFTHVEGKGCFFFFKKEGRWKKFNLRSLSLWKLKYMVKMSTQGPSGSPQRQFGIFFLARDQC